MRVHRDWLSRKSRLHWLELNQRRVLFLRGDMLVTQLAANFVSAEFTLDVLPAVRAAPGSRSGPNTSRATRATSNSSEKLIPNMRHDLFFADGLFESWCCGVEGLRLIQRLDWRLSASFFFITHGFAKPLDRLTDIGTQGLEFLGAENQYDHHQNDDPVFPVKNAHVTPSTVRLTPEGANDIFPLLPANFVSASTRLEK
eukprot:gene6033-6994_t